MTKPKPLIQRFHSLDNLRAIMMLLVVVAHAAVTYSKTAAEDIWRLKDPNSQHEAFDYIFNFIYHVPMPLFFMVAGFFGALLFYERGPRSMLQNRLKRIIYPFIIFLILLWPLIICSWAYTRSVFTQNPKILSILNERLSNPKGYIPIRTFHLWFLYYLAIISFVGWIVAKVLRKAPKLSQQVNRLFNLSMQYQLAGLVIFASFTFILFNLFNLPWTKTNVTFIPHVQSLVLYSVYYIWGWLLFKSNNFLYRLSTYSLLFICTGMALFLLQNIFKNSISLLQLMVINAIMVWMFIFGITGVFVRYMDSHYNKMRYLSDSAYWVYLVHFPFTVFIPGLLIHFRMPAIAKFLIVLSITMVFCLLTYHFFVRGTFIGEFINGKKIQSKHRKADAGEFEPIPAQAL